MKSKYDLFFSYSHQDGGIARHLVQKLETAGLTCFLAEKDIGAGEQWEPRIREAIHEADRMLLLITPRSRESRWVLTEAGAAWALQKDLIAALMFVEANELIDPIRRYQARLVETPEQVDALVSELTSHDNGKRSLAGLSGQWLDDQDRDVAFFQQVNDRVVGFYDYGSGDRKVGVYRGVMRNDVFDYHWKWLKSDLEGHGRMKLSPDGQRLSGEWWYSDDTDNKEGVNYRRVSDKMPPWVSSKDFWEYKKFFGGFGGKDEI